MSRIFVGHAALWGLVDLKSTMYAEGCFSRSISAFQSGMNIPVLLGHTATEPLAGVGRERRPAGRVLALRQDATGLEVTGALEPVDDFQASQIEKMLRHPLGLSLGSWSHETKWMKRIGSVFRISDCLIFEVSISTMPAKPGEFIYFPSTRIENEPVAMEPNPA